MEAHRGWRMLLVLWMRVLDLRALCTTTLASHYEEDWSVLFFVLFFALTLTGSYEANARMSTHGAP